MEVLLFIKEVNGNGEKVLHRQTIELNELSSSSGLTDFVKSCKLLFPRANFVEFSIHTRKL